MTQHYRVAILGAGFGGLGMGAELVRAGIEDFVIFEKAEEIGGVWRDNTYPGAACDTQAHVYCYSYFPHLRVSQMYAAGEEMLGYQKAMAKEFGLYDHTKFNSEIIEARWNDDEAYWELKLRNGETYTADVFVPAWGQLNAPKTPKWKGMEDYKGIMFHSAEWNHDVDLKGKKVISIGSAASAVQYVPEIAKEVGHLEVFQRSANYIFPREQITFTEEQLDAFEANPELFEESRRAIHEVREAGFERTRTDSSAQAEGAQEAIDYLNSVIEDPELREKLTPKFEFGCKRILRTSAYYPTFLRDNVTLVTEAIDHFTEKGIVTEDGVEHEADVIIFGTGFYSQNFQGDLSIIGRNGVTLADRWGEDDAEAYVGITVDGFPNMFLMYGPNTNLNHNSNIAMFEIQQRYVADFLEKTKDIEKVSADVRKDVIDQFNATMQEEMKGSAYSSECSSWYKNSKGKVINNWSGTVEEYRDLAETFNPADYEMRSGNEVLANA